MVPLQNLRKVTLGTFATLFGFVGCILFARVQVRTCRRVRWQLESPATARVGATSPVDRSKPGISSTDVRIDTSGPEISSTDTRSSEVASCALHSFKSSFCGVANLVHACFADEWVQVGT